MDMQKDPVMAFPPARELTSPTLGVGDMLSPPTNDGHPAKKSSEQTTKSMYSVHSDSSAPPSHPAETRSRLRSVFLVLSCAGAMIINVGGSYFEEYMRGVDLFWLRLRTAPPLLSPFQPLEQIWESRKTSCNGSFLRIPSRRYAFQMS